MIINSKQYKIKMNDKLSLKELLRKSDEIIARPVRKVVTCPRTVTYYFLVTMDT